jgi:hypothetical protein
MSEQITADAPAQHPAAPPATVADVMQPPVTAVEQNDHAAAAAYLMKRCQQPDQANKRKSGKIEASADGISVRYDSHLPGGGTMMLSRGCPRSGVMLLAGSLVLAVALAIALPGTARAAPTLGSGGARLAATSRAAGPSSAPLASFLLGSADLPPGFLPYAPLTGPLDAKRLQALGVDISQLGPQVHGWVRDWWSASTRTEVRNIVFDLGLRESAKSAAASFDSTALSRGGVREPFAGKRFVGFRKTGQLGGRDYVQLELSMARGPYLLALTVATPVQSSASGYQLMSRLVAAQLHKVSDDTPETDPSTSPWYAPAEWAVIFFTLFYLCIVNGIAYLRNPLRRARERGWSQRALQQSAAAKVEDVSTQAREARRIAQARFGVQSLGVLIAVRGVNPFLRPYWYLYLLAGPIIMWVAGRYMYLERFGDDKSRMALTGHRKFRIAVLFSAASVLIILGFLALVDAGLTTTQPRDAAAARSQDAAAVAAGGSLAAGLLGLALVAFGAICHRRARRLGSVEARRLMLRDSRPAVLYLRSFGDDGLKLWTATLGRPSFVERFTPRRFDAFEEVLARHLSFAGPVIALNAPGTGLAPLGAARETIDSADWRSTIATWMDKSALIVCVAPPEHVTQGLLWELETLSVRRQWAKTLIVVPPVRPENLERRWKTFLDATGKLWPSTMRPPAHDPHALVLAFRDNAWTAITARRRDEWSYGAALRQARARLGTGQGPHAEERPQSSAPSSPTPTA